MNALYYHQAQKQTFDTQKHPLVPVSGAGSFLGGYGAEGKGSWEQGDESDCAKPLLASQGRCLGHVS